MNRNFAGEAAEPAARVLGECAVSLWGLTPLERWRRWCIRAGIAAPGEDDQPLPRSGTVILLKAGAVLDEALARPLREQCPVVLAVEHPDPAQSGTRVALAAHVPGADAASAAALLGRTGFRVSDLPSGTPPIRSPAELGSAYSKALRKRAAPYAFLIGLHPLPEIERRMFSGAYKGVTDLVTKWLWPVPARWATRWAAANGISANMVTTASLILVILALWLFAAGHFLGGLVAAWAMAFLDTVDGKLARVTLTSSRRGEAFDHGIDLIHPPFWYAAWWYGLQPAASGLDGLLDISLWVIVIGYLLGRLMEGFFLWQYKFDMHAWRRIDSAFRLVTARRNPNVCILTIGALLGRPDLAFAAVAVWTALSLAFHGMRIAQAVWDQRHGRAPVSWLSDPAPAG